jgi:hypothetical protein
MRGTPSVDISGLFLKALATGVTDIDQAFGDAAVRALNEAESARYLSDPSRPPRVFLPPTFVVSMWKICCSVVKNINLVYCLTKKKHDYKKSIVSDALSRET